MWALPSISKLNAQAAEEKPNYEDALRLGFMPKFRQRIAKPDIKGWLNNHPEWKGKPRAYRDGILILGEPFECECADYGTACSGEIHAELWYDIFSDDPKGIITLCEHHDGYYGSPTEGYFYCAACERTMIENYTWELYSTIVDEEQVCLPCAAERYIADEDNWIELTAKNIKAVDFDRVRQAKHVIGVEMPVPKSIKFFDNAEFDSMDGHQISGDGIQSILRKAKDEGHTRALILCDAGYQFAVSIGIYVAAEQLVVA